MNHLTASFSPTAADTVTGPKGQRVHKDALDHTARFEERLWNPAPGIWCLVGNGLPNHTFVEGPDGIIAIDTGECQEAMAHALELLAAETSTAVVAVIYTHYHYVNGTSAIPNADSLPIWGHADIATNLSQVGTSMGAVAARGMVHQFGVVLPPEGPDAVMNVGLGIDYRHPGHAPWTYGFIPPTETFTETTSATIAGLAVEMTPAPSDAEDSITIWFPELKLCVNNIVWPSLFNVFPIRGEEYRDPRVLLTGLDHIRSLEADHLLGTHGPPLSGAADIAEGVTDYRDSIQFLWDQTVRGINRGLTMDELTAFVQLPERFNRSYLTRQFYGLAEHHVRQIHTGLRGWFDGAEEHLFPLPPAEKAARMIAGFGGEQAVRDQAAAALAADDLRWALELASWLVRVAPGADGRSDGGTPEDRSALAEILRTIAQRTTAANVRCWCLVRATELDGNVDLGRFRTHRFQRHAVLMVPPGDAIESLRVLVDPATAAGVHAELGWNVDGQLVGLKVRDGVAVRTSGVEAQTTIELTHESLSELFAGKVSLSAALADGQIAVTAGTEDDVRAFFACFEHAPLTT